MTCIYLLLHHAGRRPLIDDVVQLAREAALDRLGRLGGRGRDRTDCDVAPTHEDVADGSVARELGLTALQEGAGLFEDDGGGLGSAAASDRVLS